MIKTFKRALAMIITLWLTEVVTLRSWIATVITTSKILMEIKFASLQWVERVKSNKIWLPVVCKDLMTE